MIRLDDRSFFRVWLEKLVKQISKLMMFCDMHFRVASEITQRLQDGFMQ